ncbi:hypothetical protein QNH39_15285 [Neobacillus novalis]|uniref:DUF5067 domain-containing protein n=1 Tax=Neobacillus novalis TaxID=220687 RepID=A0AA95S9A7_9BACI|nr:hypothetical protein [Neobacillus novalis]WHY84044.1 hypothetical protein QNH39_15285 [Neobacillus novalis]
MKKLSIIIISALLAFTLSACNNNNSKSNTVSIAELTKREISILSTTSDKSFVFDFNVDSDYKEVSLWIEKYESGKLVDGKISNITSQIEQNGSIIFAIAKPNESTKQLTFNIGINSNGSAGGSISGFDSNSNGLDKMSSVWGNIPEGNTSIEGETVLAYICYSNDKSSMSSLSSDFFKDVDGHKST